MRDNALGVGENANYGRSTMPWLMRVVAFKLGGCNILESRLLPGIIADQMMAVNGLCCEIGNLWSKMHIVAALKMERITYLTKEVKLHPYPIQSWPNVFLVVSEIGKLDDVILDLNIVDPVHLQIMIAARCYEHYHRFSFFGSFYGGIVEEILPHSKKRKGKKGSLALSQ
ncbi:hypothetical protein HAX54_006713 [Datura stramonium]|uniref:Uncharacterized protein n=1 Tax=Datura stramonium TaxID=4076 RepID=A0ABS8WU88_DATST|nr:hypothetical protein [Datura stramonium]